MRRVLMTLTLALGVLLAFQGTAAASVTGDTVAVDSPSLNTPTVDGGEIFFEEETTTGTSTDGGGGDSDDGGGGNDSSTIDQS